MGYAQQVIDEVKKLAPSDETLEAATRAQSSAQPASIPGPCAPMSRVRSTELRMMTQMVAGSSSTDASYPEGEGVGPEKIVESVREFIRGEMKGDYPDVSFRVTTIKVSFNDPLDGGTDPTVDLIVALNRKDGALWIPNRDNSSWDASDPECHTRLLTAEPAVLRRTRARVIRLAKGWNKQYTDPGLSNISALALTEPGAGVAQALATFYEFAGAERIPPASPAQSRIKQETVVKRLLHAARGLRKALDNDDDEEAVRDALADVYHLYVEPGRSAREAFGSRGGNAGVGVVSGGLALRSVSRDETAQDHALIRRLRMPCVVRKEGSDLGMVRIAAVLFSSLEPLSLASGARPSGARAPGACIG